MIDFVGLLMAMASILALGAFAWYLDRRECEERLIKETLDTARLLDDSLEERLEEIDRYRHDLAATIQRLDLEQVRAAEERAGEGQYDARTV